MKLVIFGLTVSSSWGNGHATLWRGLIDELAGLGHHVVFFERDVPYYAAHRDLHELPRRARLVLYSEWEAVARQAQQELRDADFGMVTSFCPDATHAAEAVLSGDCGTVFYDMDSPVTLERVRRGEQVDYLPARGLRDFDLVLSFTGGPALESLCRDLGARRAAPLYGSVSPARHWRRARGGAYAADLSYMGTYAADRQDALEALLVEPARRLPQRRFVLAGSLYPGDLRWPPNVARVEHIPPPRHPEFYAAAPLTLNVTRRPMKEMGFAPSGRLFEAAACEVAIMSDRWPGLELFFEPGREILVCRDSDDAARHITRPVAELERIGKAARARAFADHTAARRARELVARLEAPESAPATGAA